MVMNSVSCWIALDENEEYVPIESAKASGRYSCPECGQSMIPKNRGKILQHHFAHKAGDNPDHHCGGEGYRHLRVKMMAHQILNGIRRDKFLYPMKFEMEKRTGEYIPDIRVSIEGGEILALEIIDTNPPSEEKLAHWGERMFSINIQNKTYWSSDVLSNPFLLSSMLVPKLLSFSKIAENIQTETRDINKLLADLKTQLKSEEMDLKLKHNDKMYKIKLDQEQELAQVELNKKISKSNQSTVPAMFIHEYECWKCESEIKVYSGSDPDKSSVEINDILSWGVCYSYRYVKKANRKMWVNICPHCDNTQSPQKIRDLR